MNSGLSRNWRALAARGVLAALFVLLLALGNAFALVSADPKLERAEHRSLWPALRKMFAGKLSLIDAA